MSQTQQSSSPVAWSTGVTQHLLDIARGQTAVKPMRKAIYAAQLELAAEEQKHLKRIAELEAELAQAKNALTHPAVDWDNLPEDPSERAMFDCNLKLYGGDPRVAIATSLSIWANTRGNGSFGLMCAVFANEVAKLHIAPTPAAGVPASELGLTRERIAQIAETYFHQDDTELGDMQTAIRVALREAASTVAGVPTAAPEANCPEAARTQATAALKAQAAPNLELTDEELTTIYKTANNEVGKARPLTTESIFKAMRAVAALTTARTLGANHPSVPTLDSIRFGGWCDTHVSPKPCWHCQQVEKREVVAGNQLESRK